MSCAVDAPSDDSSIANDGLTFILSIFCAEGKIHAQVKPSNKCATKNQNVALIVKVGPQVTSFPSVPDNLDDDGAFWPKLLRII